MKSGAVRIIAGKWRGRKLRVPNSASLRPTPDRVRETVFNWLAPVIDQSQCLDLFAGSGALGFEALSRGAAYVEMVDQSAEVVAMLQAELSTLAADNAHIYQAKVTDFLPATDHQFDIVFLDPPYQANLLILCCHLLESQHLLAPTAYIYLEANRVIKDNELPLNWRLVKSKRAGLVFYHLAYRESHATK